LVNLDVSTSGCYSVGVNTTIFEYLAQRTIPANSYIGPFTGSFLNGTGCASQPNCNQLFQFTTGRGGASTLTSDNTPFYNQFDTVSKQILYATYPKANARGGGGNNNPNIFVRLLGGACLTPGQTYYLKFNFTSKGNSPIYVSFEGTQPPQTGIYTTNDFILPANIEINTNYYVSVTYNGTCSSVTPIKKMWFFRNAASTTNDDIFYMDISTCSFV
jgi:hypothetical protein